MTTDQMKEDKLRFNAGRFEDSLLGAIMTIQFTLALLAVMMVLGWIVAMVERWFDPAESALAFGPYILLPVGLALAVHLLNILYDVE
ncbi:hypothetical protein [Halosolutus halophilus]|uniref:hypothetical protein n=1 Tax=Halosolutus halophilus TaxID=1552990 RepID=UPI0022351DB1|nr:hypothetical protein [Halosolutus halophilus]